jgi:hypothetical protein
MLQLCPRCQENNAFFNCLFLNKLPRELRILILEAEMADKQALGARAELFAAQELAAGNATAAGDSEAAAGGVRRSRDAGAAVAADSRCPIRCLTQSRPGSGVGCASTTSTMEPKLRGARLPVPGR